jgi:LPS O-antigen subunit length determinant protein (WzzB/FepE family)
MKQTNRVRKFEAKRDAHQKMRDSSKSVKGNPYKQNIAGASLHRVDKSMRYEYDFQKVLALLRNKGIIVNDSGTTLRIRVSQNYEVNVPNQHIYVGLGKEVGNKTKGKIDFLTKYAGYSCFGWSDLKG